MSVNDDSATEARHFEEAEPTIAEGSPRAASDGRPLPRRLGRYLLCRELASGGMGTVFLALARGLGGFEKPVAVKCIHPHLARDAAFVRRFVNEARLASRIAHPHVASAFDVGEIDGVHFLAMEYLDGEPLGTVASAVHASNDPDRRKSWPFLAMRAIADAAEGLHAAHELVGPGGALLHVIHRDVSPQNLFVTYDGSVKVVDFGIAKAGDRMVESTTGELKGKYAYMAPEQLLPRGEITRRVDLWALGVTLHEILTGHRLFARKAPMATIDAVLRHAIPAPSTLNPDLPDGIDEVLARALERDPVRRYGTARELGRDLRAVIATNGKIADAPELAELMEAQFPSGRATSQRWLDEAQHLSHLLTRQEIALNAKTPRWMRWAALLALILAVLLGIALGIALPLLPPAG